MTRCVALLSAPCRNVGSILVSDFRHDSCGKSVNEICWGRAELPQGRGIVGQTNGRMKPGATRGRFLGSGQVPGVRLLRLDYLDGLSARALGVASLPLTFLTRSKRFPERAADWREKILRSEPPPVRLFRRLRSAWSRVEFVADSVAERNPWRADLGQGSDRLRAGCPIRTTGARERISGSRHGAAWTAV